VALDFGCGNGVFTEVLVSALPNWEVLGTDISQNALARARANVPGATFFLLEDTDFGDRKVDLVFTHHVLEHVIDLDEALHRVDAFLEHHASVLHILPCGNPGSFEHQICELRRDGLEPHRGSRFFFEEPSHVRRLDSKQITDWYEMRGFRLILANFSCQHSGAINWITHSTSDFIRDLADPACAVDAVAARRLAKLRRRLLRIAFLRAIKRRVVNRLSWGRWSIRSVCWLIAVYPLYLIGKRVDQYWEDRDAREWSIRKNDPNGSEMYLFFQR
jgi:ubiquinone/menaquinone biosynthesis C-methylase UbiE